MSDWVDRTLIGLAVALGIMGLALVLVLGYSIASGRVYRGDVCDFRIWGHCAGRQQSPGGD